MNATGDVRSRRLDDDGQLSRIEGRGLILRGWDEALTAQMAAWGERGFPYHPFDLGRLRDPAVARATLMRMTDRGPHRHYVATEGDTAVGRASVNVRDPAGLYLWSVHVPPEHEGRGICRRMLAALMDALEIEYPRTDFVLTTNTFATHAHRAYFALGFQVAETRWQFDAQLVEGLWRQPGPMPEPLADHFRFLNGQWQVRTYLMRRRPGARMETDVRGRPSAD